MTRAIVALREGNAFQARMFWLRAASLLDNQSPVRRVGFETGPKGFDDIWVEYSDGIGPRDADGALLLREHIQCKWHVTPGSYGYAALTDPAFVNANARSLLERARDAQRNCAPTGTRARFNLVSNWRVDPKDPLGRLIRTCSRTLHVERLFGTKTDRSITGHVRSAWRKHLQIDDSELRLLASTLAFGEVTDSLDELRERLDDRFGFVGLRRIPISESAFVYDDVAFRWLSQGRVEFDRMSFHAACKGEGLLKQGSGSPKTFGVKSFEHPIDRLEDRCVKVLDFVQLFDERYIRSTRDWKTEIYPRLQSFLVDAARSSEGLRLSIDAHPTIAFAAGAVLNIKSGRAVALEQRTTDRRVWFADDSEPSLTWPTLVGSVEQVRKNAGELAVAVSLTHDVRSAVRAYVTREIPQVGRILTCAPSTGPGSRAVVCGRHAFDLAESLTTRIRAETAGRSGDRIHLFVAGPNAFTFFLGQRREAINPCRIYEFDFDGARGGSYRPSLELPLSAEK